MLPPVRARIFLKTSASARRSWRASHGEFGFPARWFAYYRSPRPMAQPKIFWRFGEPASTVAFTRP
jgi:hypothetical protein